MVNKLVLCLLLLIVSLSMFSTKKTNSSKKNKATKLHKTLTHKNKSKKSHAKSHTKTKDTPKGMNLRNHFGTPNLSNRYGPREDQLATYVTGNPEIFAPMLGAKNRAKLEHANDYHSYKGSEKKMWPHAVKSGHYDNIAPSASYEINPEITGPKLHVSGSTEYPMSVKTPTFYGFKKEFVPVDAYDKVTGEIIAEHQVLNRPVYNYENRVTNVQKNFDRFYDLRNGNPMTKNRTLKSHGFSTIPELGDHLDGRTRAQPKPEPDSKTAPDYSDAITKVAAEDTPEGTVSSRKEKKHRTKRLR
jgi:hypothetical protein